MPKAKADSIGIPLEQLATRGSYVSERLMRGDRRKCTCPSNGIPKTKVESGPAPSIGTILGIPPRERQ